MNELTTLQSDSSASLWIHNLVDGMAGMTMKAKHAAFCGASRFQKIEIFDTYAFGRVLLMAGNLVFTEKDENIYHEMICHPAMLKHPSPQSVCIIGGGDGGCLREVLKHPTVQRIMVVDIDALVKKTVETYFPAMAKGFSDPRVQLAIDDGCAFLEKCGDQFDVILIDSYDPGGPVQSLETANFYKLVKSRLAPGGIAVFQTDSPVIKSDFLRKTMVGVSPYLSAQRPYICTIPSFPMGICSFLMCANAKKDLDKANTERVNEIAAGCSYFCGDILQGAFLLPKQIRQSLDM
jgi:spermidine synthase